MDIDVNVGTDTRNEIVLPGPFKANPIIEYIFTYHAPVGDQPLKYQRIREAAKALAYVIDQCCEPGPDRSAAIRHVREAAMTANASRRSASPRAA